jgi:hypothetical protein
VCRHQWQAEEEQGLSCRWQEKALIEERLQHQLYNRYCSLLHREYLEYLE